MVRKASDSQEDARDGKMRWLQDSDLVPNMGGGDGNLGI